MGLQQSFVFAKTKDLRGQIQTKQKDKMETSNVDYEGDYNNCLKKVYL